MKELYENAILEADKKCKDLISGKLTPDLEVITNRERLLRDINTSKAWRKIWFKNNRGTIYSFTSAAVILLLISLLIFIPDRSISENDLKLSGLMPADGVVTLTLSSGKVVDLKSDLVLTDSTKGLILENKQNTISYKNLADINTSKTLDSEVRISDLKAEYNELAIPKGRSYSLVLSDGTKIWLNALSKIKYPVRFDNHERRVVISGEAYFEVAKNEKVPFIVETSYYDVKVLGTKFNVNAYSDEKEVATTLLSGLVSIPSADGSSTVVEPGEQYKYDKETKKSTLKTVNTDLYISWTNNNLLMEQMTLADIFKVLTRRYEIDTFFTEEGLKDETFSGLVPLNDSLEVILDQISKVSDVEFRIEGKLIMIKYK
ncbi:MAG: FecR family protein [Bacteroidales bacterium]